MVGRHSEKLDIAKNSINNNFKIFTYACDLSNESEIEGLFTFIRKKFQRLDFLVNNVGAYSEKTAWNEIDYDLWLKTFETNVLSAYFCTVRAADIMAANQTGGAIVNIGSSAAFASKKGKAALFCHKIFASHAFPRCGDGAGKAADPGECRIAWTNRN